MAKKIKEEIDYGDAKERLQKEIEKEFGRDIFLGAEMIMERPRQIIPVSPAVDIILGGGIPEGTLTTISGPPKIGKTTLTLHVCANAQKEEYGARHVYYIDAEFRLKARDLQNIPHLNRDKFTLIQSSEDRILSAQDNLHIAERILRTHKKCVLVFDSFSALCHSKELEEGIGTSTRGGTAMLLGQFCRQMSGTIGVNRNIVVGIVHLMANTSGYGPAFTEKGGLGIGYHCDVKLRAKAREYWKIGDNAKPIGQIVTWIADNTALNAPPSCDIKSYIRYGKGIDETQELIELGIETGLISKAGSWYYCEFLKNIEGEIPKFQGSEALNTAITQNTMWLTQLQASIKNLL